MVLDVFNVVMFTKIGGKGLGEKDTNVGRTNVGAYYKRWGLLQTLGLSEAGGWGALIC